MKLLNLLQPVAHVEAGDSDSAIADFLLSKAHERLPGLAGALHSFDVTSIAWEKAKIIRVFRQLLQEKADSIYRQGRSFSKLAILCSACRLGVYDLCLENK